MLAEFRGVLSGLALVAAAVLLASHVSLGIPGQPLLSSIQFHLAAATLVLPVLLAAAGAWRRALLMLAVILLSLAAGATTIARQQAGRMAADPAPAASFTLLSFNVFANNERGAEIAEMILERQPDLVVIMEASGLAASLPLLADTYPHQYGCGPGEACDLLMLSRLPVESAEVVPLGSLRRERLGVARIDVGGEALTLVGVHLSKPYFDEVAEEELWEVWHALRDISGPVVLAGDFNATAWSRDVARLIEGAGLVPPPSYPATWPVRLGPLGVPIDNVFTRSGAQVRSIEALPDSLGSNHRALWAVIDLLSATP